MREFMDYVHSAFYEATGWRRENSYAALNSTTDALLKFQTPQGLRLSLSSLASPNFATSYQLGSVGVVDGSISYLFSSVPLKLFLTPQSENVPLPALLRSYKPLSPLTRRDDPSLRKPEDNDRPHSSLLYGRLYLPQSQLEALLVRRLSPGLQAQLSAVSGQRLRNGGTALGLLQYDVGKYALEGLASTDGGLLGFRGVYNFGGDVDGSPPPTVESGNGDKERIYGRFSTGGEIYYGTLNKSGGISIGARFETLPAHRGTPLSATLTLNPLMGNIAASYAVKAGKDCSLATRMEFNIFSYESQWAVGMELWRRPFTAVDKKRDEDGAVKEGKLPERSFQAKLEWRLDEPQELSSQAPKTTPFLDVEKSSGNNAMITKEEETGGTVKDKFPVPSVVKAVKEMEESSKTTNVRTANGSDDALPWPSDEEKYAGVLKARLDQNLRVGVLWEGRVKSLLFSLGSGIDLRKGDKPFRTLGLEIQFSS